MKYHQTILITLIAISPVTGLSNKPPIEPKPLCVTAMEPYRSQESESTPQVVLDRSKSGRPEDLEAAFRFFATNPPTTDESLSDLYTNTYLALSRNSDLASKLRIENAFLDFLAKQPSARGPLSESDLYVLGHAGSARLQHRIFLVLKDNPMYQRRAFEAARNHFMTETSVDALSARVRLLVTLGGVEAIVHVKEKMSASACCEEMRFVILKEALSAATIRLLPEAQEAHSVRAIRLLPEAAHSLLLLGLKDPSAWVRRTAFSFMQLAKGRFNASELSEIEDRAIIAIQDPRGVWEGGTWRAALNGIAYLPLSSRVPRAILEGVRSGRFNEEESQEIAKILVFSDWPEDPDLSRGIGNFLLDWLESGAPSQWHVDYALDMAVALSRIKNPDPSFISRFFDIAERGEGRFPWLNRPPHGFSRDQWHRWIQPFLSITVNSWMPMDAKNHKRAIRYDSLLRSRPSL